MPPHHVKVSPGVGGGGGVGLHLWCAAILMIPWSEALVKVGFQA